MAGPSLKGKEIMEVEEYSRPICTCMDEFIHANSIDPILETLVASLQEHFQEHNPHVFEACCHVLHQYTIHEMAGREAFDQLTCILTNDVDILEIVLKVFALKMSVKEWLTRQLDMHPVDGLTVQKIIDFYGL